MSCRRIHIVAFVLIIGSEVSLVSFVAAAQEYTPKDINLERLIDEVYPIQDLDINYEDLYENLAQLLSNPLDLNTLTREQLRSIYILNEEQITAFFNYRNQFGPLLSIYELQVIPSFDEKTIQKLIYLVTAKANNQSTNTIAARILSNKNNYLILRFERTLEQKKGYLPQSDPSNQYLGSPSKFYSRFRTSQTNDFSVGFTLENDPGEAFRWKPAAKQYGPDFLSFHAQLINKGRIQNIVLGDFQAQFGQGLTLGGGFSTGKGSETITTMRRSNLGFLPYTSVNESGFLRGAAVSYSLLKKLTLHALLSTNTRDGQLNNDNLGDDGVLLSSIASSGLHRTENEITKRRQLSEVNTGLILDYKKNNLEGGIIFLQTAFDPSIGKTIRPYNQFSFTGGSNTNIGAFINYCHNNYTFFSEFAQSINQGKAIIAGTLASLSPKLDVSLLYRNYAPNFYSFYGNALAENTQAQNESAIYWGYKYTISKNYSLSGYVDLFNFPWLRYRGYSPSFGKEWLIRFNYQPSKNILFFIQAREESKQRNVQTNNSLYQTAPGNKSSYWVNCDYSVTPALSFKTRIQTSKFQLASATTNGIAIVQDININVRKFSFSARYALFQTDDYDNRLYIYERDVWLGFSFQPYAGVGTRSYALLQYKLSEKIDLWFRWATTTYQNTESIGSGFETISGNSKNDIKFQTRIRF